LTLSIQLKFEDEIHYNEFISPNTLPNMLDQLKKDLSETTPLDISRLIIDDKIQKVNNDEKQILLSITVLPPENNDGSKRNTESIMKDLNELIKEKQVNPLSQGNITRFLDENYGAQLIRMQYILLNDSFIKYCILDLFINAYSLNIANYWKRYKTILIIFTIAIVILSMIIFLAHRKYPEVLFY